MTKAGDGTRSSYVLIIIMIEHKAMQLYIWRRTICNMAHRACMDLGRLGRLPLPFDHQQSLLLLALLSSIASYSLVPPRFLPSTASTHLCFSGRLPPSTLPTNSDPYQPLVPSCARATPLPEARRTHPSLSPPPPPFPHAPFLRSKHTFPPSLLRATTSLSPSFSNTPSILSPLQE